MTKFFTSKVVKALAFSSLALVAGNAMAQDAERKLYLCDVYTEAELTSDVFGVPMVIDRVGDGKYMARYYNAKADNKIYFSANKTDFTDVYGVDEDGNWTSGAKLDDVKPIVLPEAGKYYQIDIDENEGTVAAKTYEVEDYMNPIFYEYGSESINQWAEYDPESGDAYAPKEGAWLVEFKIGTAVNPAEVDFFVQDPANKNAYMWETPKQLESGVELNFIIHNYHSNQWWDYISWRTDDSETCEKVNFYGNVVKSAYLKWAYGEDCDWAQWAAGTDYHKNFVADNWFKPTVQASGTYQFYFDAHLGRAKLVPATSSGIADAVAGEEMTQGPAEYFNLSGMRVDGDNLPAGIYIKRQGSKASKVYVK